MKMARSRTPFVSSTTSPLRVHTFHSFKCRRPLVYPRRQTINCRSVQTLMANDWPLWTAVMGLALLGDLSGKTPIGRVLSTPVLLMIFGFCAAFVGILPVESLCYDAIWTYGVPFSTVLYVLNADLSSSAGWVVPVFSLGAIGTMIGTVVAWVLCGQCLGSEGWKIASALCATYIGGSVNFAAISSMLEMQKGHKKSDIVLTTFLGSLIVAAMAVDNIVMMVYLMIISLVKTREPEFNSKTEMKLKRSSGLKNGNLVLGIFLALSCCTLGKTLASALNSPNLSIAFMVLLASCCSSLMKQTMLSYSTQSCKDIGDCLMSVFFLVIGATSGSIRSVLRATPWMFLFASIQITVHLLFLLTSGWILKIPLKQILTASNANIGGPATAAGMASARGWDEMIQPAVNLGCLGYTSANFLGMLVSYVLQLM